jgi:hypothetical protein
VAGCEGLLTLAAGRSERAIIGRQPERHPVGPLLERMRAGGSVAVAAQTKLDWASMLTTRGRRGDGRLAQRLIDEARAFADEMDVPRLHRAARCPTSDHAAAGPDAHGVHGSTAGRPN